MAVSLERRREGSRGEQSNQAEITGLFWRLKVPSKIKTFGWRLYLDSLHTFMCEDCNDHGYWLWLCAKICSEEEFRILLIGCWLTWHNRNNVVHGKGSLSLEAARLKLKVSLEDFRKGSGLEVQWLEEDPRKLEGPLIFCDASFDVSVGLAGFGIVGVFNGELKQFRAQWMENVDSVIHAEGEAIKLGLHLAEEWRMEKVTILSDCREAVRAISAGGLEGGSPAGR